MRLAKKDIDKRLSIKLDKSIKSSGVDGIMLFGKDNDYPQIIERIVNSSVTAKSVRNIYSKFLHGQGFENKAINNIIIGKDNRGKNVTISKLHSLVCDQMALHNGSYIHTNYNLNGKIVSAKLVPFKYCRFSKPDDTGYSAKIGVYENWDKDPEYWKKYDKTNLKFYDIFNINQEALISQIKKAGDIKKFKGQINFEFLDNQFLYPLSPFDVVCFDCDTENQVSVYKNNTTRNGMTKKTVLRLQEPTNKTDADNLEKEITEWQGVDGDNILVLYDDIDPETGEIKRTGAFAVDSIDSSMDDKLFEGWQKELSNNIRKCVMALPEILIDYDGSKLGTTSGESLKLATEFYNAMTDDNRNVISNMFKEIFSNFDNEILSNNQNWNIKPLDLYGKFINNIQTAGY